MSRAARSAAVLAACVAMAVVAAYPLSTHPGSRVMYEGDSLLNAWILAWSAPQLLRDPGRLFDAPAFLPYEDALAFSEHLLFPSLLSWPARALSGNPLLAHNLLVLAFLAAGAFAMYLLARELTRETGPALVAGALFAFHTFAVNEVQRLQIQAQLFFPLGLLVLVRHFAAPRGTTAVAFAAVALLCGLSNNYYQLYMPLLFAVALPWLTRRAPAPRRALVLLAAALFPVAMVFAALGLKYVAVAERLGFVRDLPMGIGLEKYLSARPENWIYGELVPGARLQTQAAHFTGFLPLVLAGAAAWGAARRRVDRGLVAAAFAGLALFVLLSLGQDVTLFGHVLAPGPYRLLYRLPGFSLVRIPERFALLAMLWLAILSALGAQVMLRRLDPGRRTAGLALAALVFAEHLSAPIRTIAVPTGDARAEVYRWLERYPARRVAEVPFYGPRLNRLDSLTMFFAIGSPRAIVNGYTGFSPPAYGFLRHRLSSEPGEAFLETVARLGLDHLVVHPHLWPEGERERWLAFLGAVPDRLRLVRAFAPGAGHAEPAWDHGGELVYEVRMPPLPPARVRDDRVPVPAGPGWTASASRGVSPEAVLDGDPRTEWTPDDLSRAGEFLEVRFGEDHEIRGVRLLLTYPHTGYPGPLEVSARREDGRWRLMRHDQRAAERELLERLLASGHASWYALDFDPVRANGIRLVVPRADPTLDMWRVAELQAYR